MHCFPDGNGRLAILAVGYGTSQELVEQEDVGDGGGPFENSSGNSPSRHLIRKLMDQALHLHLHKAT